MSTNLQNFEVNEKHRNEAGKYETHKRESKELNNLSGNLFLAI